MDQTHGLGCATRTIVRAVRRNAGIPFLHRWRDAPRRQRRAGKRPSHRKCRGAAHKLPPAKGSPPIGDTHLWYWDTGGEGPPVVLLHPASGSGLIWGYQQPVLVKAGYRVIAYSRRSYFNSDALAKDRPGIGSADLHGLIEFLGLTKFHLLGSAAGGTVAVDYALSHPDRL